MRKGRVIIQSMFSLKVKKVKKQFDDSNRAGSMLDQDHIVSVLGMYQKKREIGSNVASVAKGIEI